MRWLDGITNTVGVNFSKLREIVKDRDAWGLQSMWSQRVGHNLVTEQQQRPKGLSPDVVVLAVGTLVYGSVCVCVCVCVCAQSCLSLATPRTIALQAPLPLEFPDNIAGVDCHFIPLGEFSSVAQSRPGLCNHTVCSTPGLPVLPQLPELTQTHVR